MKQRLLMSLQSFSDVSPWRKVPKSVVKVMYNDQRIITIAREARGWTQAELGEKIFTEKSCVSRYERGMVRAPWEILYDVMPELREMRENGCAYYCDQSHL